MAAAAGSGRAPHNIMLISWAAAVAAQTCDQDAIDSFRRDGYAVLRGFASGEEVSAMRASMEQMGGGQSSCSDLMRTRASDAPALTRAANP